MKKIFVISAILLVGLVSIVVSALWITRGSGPAEAAALLPADTVAMASLPDLPRTAARWPKTILAKIGAEPEMQAFLEKPIQLPDQ